MHEQPIHARSRAVAAHAAASAGYGGPGYPGRAAERNGARHRRYRTRSHRSHLAGRLELRCDEREEDAVGGLTMEEISTELRHDITIQDCLRKNPGADMEGVYNALCVEMLQPNEDGVMLTWAIAREVDRVFFERAFKRATA